MKKSHATRHRRQATQTRITERVQSRRRVEEAEERARAGESARWMKERHRFWGMPITARAGLAAAISVELAEQCRVVDAVVREA